MKCLKCGYRRQPVEAAPDWQCPACGVAYAKFQGPDQVPAAKIAVGPDRGASGGRWWKIVLALGLIAGALQFLNYYGNEQRKALENKDFSRAQIVMYSLTTCVYCAELRKTFHARGIPFTEYYIDEDDGRMKELFAKLRTSGYQSNAIGTPTLEVNGTMLPNNPSLETILRHL